MTQQFHEGQNVEVEGFFDIPNRGAGWQWRKAKIIRFDTVRVTNEQPRDCWEVQFPDNSRGVFDAAHIRALMVAQHPRPMLREAIERLHVAKRNPQLEQRDLGKTEVEMCEQILNMERRT
jgi:hypothetical protein